MYVVMSITISIVEIESLNYLADYSCYGRAIWLCLITTILYLEVKVMLRG